MGLLPDLTPAKRFQNPSNPIERKRLQKREQANVVGSRDFSILEGANHQPQSAHLPQNDLSLRAFKSVRQSFQWWRLTLNLYIGLLEYQIIWSICLLLEGGYPGSENSVGGFSPIRRRLPTPPEFPTRISISHIWNMFFLRPLRG